MSNNKRILSVVLALILALSVIPTMPLSVSAEETDYTAPEGFTPEPNKIYFDVNGTGWEMGAKDKVAFFIYGGDFGTEANPTTPYGWGGKKPIGTATTGVSGMYEIDPAAKLGYTFTEGIQYKISFVHTSGNKWIEQTHDLYFTSNCLGHVAYCNGETRPYEIDPSKSALVPHWDSEDLDGGLQFYYHRYPIELGGNVEIDIDPTCLDITGYTGKKSDLEIPATIDSLPVDGIEDNAFEGNENLKSVKLPDSVSSIGDSAFYNCTALTDIPLPDSIWTIGNYAFANCAGLTNFSIPDTVRVIGSGAFNGCTGLTEINIPSSITTINDNTFNYCTGLTSITIPDAVTKIGDYAFSRCTGLTKIVIPDSVTSIGDNAFSGCTGLTEIVIPDSVTEIGEGAFEGCTGLTSVKLPDSITGIEDNTFAGCTGLTDFTLPSSIEYVAKTAFEETDFEGIWYNDQPDGVLYWGTKAMGYKGICPETIWIRPGTTELEGEYYGYDLQTIVLPDGLEKIEDFKSSISSITLPDSVWSFPYKFNTTIGTDATGMTRYSFRPITIYGRKGSYAEIFVDNLKDPEVMKNLGPDFENTYTFVPLQTREAKRVSVYPLEEEQELSVEDITDSFDKTAVPANFEIVKVYDVSIKKDGETVNPDRYFELYLDTTYYNISASKSKVYRVEADGSLTDMRAKVVGSFEDVLFSTSRLGTFILTTGAEVKPPICGDADGDGKVTVKDATFIQRYLVNLDSGIDLAVITRNGDVDGDGKVTIIDAALIQRKLVGLSVSYPIGKALS